MYLYKQFCELILLLDYDEKNKIREHPNESFAHGQQLILGGTFDSQI